MSLESKAKSYEEVYALWKEAWKKTVDGVHNPLLEQKWVRLEDAQKEVRELKDYISDLTRRDVNYADELEDCKSRLEKLREHLEMILTQFRQYKDAEILEVNADYVEVKLEKALKFIEEASEDNLTSEEIADVEEAWNEIERGEAKKFTNVEEFLRDLKKASER